MTQDLFTEEEFTELKQTMESIGAYLPTDKTHYIWSTYVKIKGKPEPKPCQCPSSGKLWKKAVDTIRDYIKNVG